MDATIKEVVEFAYENDVKFIRLAFCDVFGTQKNISIMSDRLEEAFKSGVSIDGSAVKGFSSVDQSDLLLFPDPGTLAVLPWRPQQGRVLRFFCDIKNPDGTDYICDSRTILKNVIDKFSKKGYICNIGTECEFYLFKTDENGEPSKVPMDKGGYLDISPLDKGENVRREICLTLEDMGISPESSHHEQGPGQNEIDFLFSDAVSAADNLLTFKSVVKIISARNGLFASFMPKPIADKSGNGMHINVSLSKGGKNIFKDEKEGHSVEAESFIAGVLSRAAEISLFLNPIPNSYERIGKMEAPKYVSWSHRNRSQLIRIPASQGERMRMELRSPDPTVNPYLAFALILAAGLEGIENNAILQNENNEDLYSVLNEPCLEKLPCSFETAITMAEKSKFISQTLGEELFDKYITAKKEELAELIKSDDKDAFYDEMYFPVC